MTKHITTMLTEFGEVHVTQFVGPDMGPGIERRCIQLDGDMRFDIDDVSCLILALQAWRAELEKDPPTMKEGT